MVIPNVFTALKTPRIQLNSCTFIAHIRSIHVIRINHCSPLPNKWILMSMLLLMNVLNEFIMTPSKSKISKVHPPQYYHTVQQTLVYLFSFGKADHHVTEYVDEKYWLSISITMKWISTFIITKKYTSTTKCHICIMAPADHSCVHYQLICFHFFYTKPPLF